MADMTFQVIAREEISRVVSGVDTKSPPIRVESLAELEKLLGENSIGLVEGQAEGRGLPLVVVKDEQIRSFYAWISTYLPGVSPLSQLVRVTALSELKDALVRRVSADARVRQGWVGVVLGECMSRTPDIRSFSGMSLAAAQSATSLPIAKMYALGVTIAEYERAINRLSWISSKNPVPSGSLKTSELLPVWSALSGCDFSQRRSSLIGVKVQELLSSGCAELVLDSRVSNDLLLAMARFFEPARELTRFDAATAEVRLRIFDDMVSARDASVDATSELGQIQAFVFGYAASRIATGGMRHVALLDDLGSLAGIAKVWFCLSCFVTGRASMSDSMVNLARLIDRELRYEFSIFQVPRHDIGWDEFSMFSIEGNYNNSLSLLPKASPRSASIEIVPGAAIVVSVSSKDQAALADPVVSKPLFDDKFVKEKIGDLDNAIAEIWKVRQAFLENRAAIGSAQPQERSSLSEKKPARRKRKAPDPSDLF